MTATPHPGPTGCALQWFPHVVPLACCVSELQVVVAMAMALTSFGVLTGCGVSGVRPSSHGKENLQGGFKERGPEGDARLSNQGSSLPGPQVQSSSGYCPIRLELVTGKGRHVAAASS